MHSICKKCDEEYHWTDGHKCDEKDDEKCPFCEDKPCNEEHCPYTKKITKLLLSNSN